MHMLHQALNECYFLVHHGHCLLIISGDDFDIIQQEIILMQDCKHQNIVQYLGSYLRYQFIGFVLR